MLLYSPKDVCADPHGHQTLTRRGREMCTTVRAGPVTPLFAKPASDARRCRLPRWTAPPRVAHQNNPDSNNEKEHRLWKEFYEDWPK
jgi:hypothetical protein